MRRITTAIILVLLVLSGCSLFLQDTYYFYSMFDGTEDPPYEFELRSTSSGYTIFMSKGREGTGYTQSEAQSQIVLTDFSLTLDGVALATDGTKSVAKLDAYWHVVQEYATGPLIRGRDYTLVGTTDGSDVDRSETILLHIR